MKTRSERGSAVLLAEKDVADGRESPQRRVGSVRDAIAILRHLAALDGAAQGVNRIARALDIGPSSCFNLLKTLVDEQFIDFDPESKLYSLGPGAIALGRRALDPAGAFGLVRQRLEAMTDKYQVTAGLLRTRRGEQLTFVGFADNAAAFSIRLSVGQRIPNAAGAAGRCVMAFSGLNDAAIRRRFNAVKWGQAPDFDAFMADVEKVRTTHWSIDDGRFVPGATSVASPCLNPDGRAEYIITATMFTGQHPRRKLEQIAGEVRAQADWLSARLFRPDAG